LHQNNGSCLYAGICKKPENNASPGKVGLFARALFMLIRGKNRAGLFVCNHIFYKNMNKPNKTKKHAHCVVSILYQRKKEVNPHANENIEFFAKRNQQKTLY